MSASLELHIDLADLFRSVDKAQDALCEAVLADSTPLVPKDTGALRDSGRVTGKDEITWSEDYADYVYSGTSSMPARPWFEEAKSRYLNDWVDICAKVISDD